MTDWAAHWDVLRELDGDEWDASSERLDALWQAEYAHTFVEYALSRRGWTREIVDEALLYRAGDPVEAAQADVVACEHEAREID